MLLLAALVATAASSCGFAQEIPMQSPTFITKSKGSVRLQCNFKDVSEAFDTTIIHWYQQKANKSPQRILYFSNGKVVEEGFQAHRYLVEKVSHQKLCVLTINDIIPDDTATYYCAYWRSHRGKVSSQPAHSEILQKNHENETTYVCLIEKFYPEVIRVTWTDEAHKEVTDNVVQGDPWKATEEGEYSISTWLTVSAANKDKNYHCKYEHESKEHSLQTQEFNKPPSWEEDCSTYTGNSTVFNRDHLMHRTAYLVYIVLLLKSFIYYLIVLFFIYRRWAPTKHEGKKA